MSGRLVRVVPNDKVEDYKKEVQGGRDSWMKRMAYGGFQVEVEG